MKKKIRISQWLIGSTIGLLFIFQGWWINIVYKDSFLSVRREISVVLRESLLKDQMQSFMGDSGYVLFRKDTITEGGARMGIVQTSDTKKKGLNGQTPDSINLNIQVSEGTNAGKQNFPKARIMAMEPSGMENAAKPPMVITLPINRQMLENGKLPDKYRKVLLEAGLPADFTLTKTEKNAFRRGMKPPFRANSSALPHMELTVMEIDFGNPISHILSRMYGQIAFSAFMSCMVLLAFWFMYKNLKDQMQLAVLKNDFVSNMAHELKTPVATVSVAIEALKSFNVIDNPQRTKEYLDISSLELNRLALLIDKVLRINLFESGKWELEMKNLDLSELTSEVIQAQQIQAGKLHGEIRWVKPATVLMVKGDRLHLMSVLYNLLENALKYRRENPVIELSLEQKGGNIIWQVKDNGQGIDPKFKDKIFEKFFRVPNGDRHDVKGYGLGLSYVYEVVQKHSGTISVASEPGKGSTFTIIIPEA